MRVFVALDIDDAIRARLEQFLDGVRGFSPEARWVRPESMHVTLKFIGEKPSDAVEEIKQALGADPGWRDRDFISWLRIFSNFESPSCFLGWHWSRPGAVRSGEIGG